MTTAKKSPASAAIKESRTAGSVETKATTAWACLETTCDATGDTEASAEKHTKTGHATTTATTPTAAASIAALAKGGGRR